MPNSDFFHNRVYKLTNMSLTSADGSKNIDITGLLQELTIFENIYEPVMSGQVTLSDATNLLQKLPVTGFETIILQWTKQDEDKPIEKKFRVYKVDDIQIDHVSQNKQFYTLCFCSEELLLAVSNNFSKSYKGVAISEIITDILKNFLKVDTSKMDIEQTKGKIDYVLPTMDPLQAIAIFTSRTIGTSMFFENANGFNLKHLSNLFKQSKKADFYYLNKNTAPHDDDPYGMRNISKFEYLDTTDTMTAIDSGLFASNLKTIDPIRQVIDDVNFDYTKEFGKNTHIETGGKSFFVESTDRLKKKPTENFQSLRRYFITTKDHDKGNIASKQPNVKPNNVEQWMLQRISAIESLNFLRLKLVVPGDVTLTVGDIINVDIPAMEPKDESDSTTFIHPEYTGRWLIASIRHKINLTSYEMNIEIVKDSYNTKAV